MATRKWYILINRKTTHDFNLSFFQRKKCQFGIHLAGQVLARPISMKIHHGQLFVFSILTKFY
jgi:hypothetical protein